MSSSQDDVEVLYIGGFGRSGSTLLERSIGELADACAVGELVHLWERGLGANELCGCGQAFDACPFWLDVGRRAFGGWEALDLDAVLRLKRAVDRNRYLPRLMTVLGPDARRRVREYTALYRAVYRAALDVSGARFVVDSSKHASLAYCLRRGERLRLRFLHVVRDSPGVAHSWSKVVRRPEAGDWMPTYTPARVALWWDFYNIVFPLLRLYREPVRLVRYEAFVRDARATVADVARFTDSCDTAVAHVEPDAVTVRVGHTIAGNPMRFRSGRIVIRADDAWRSDLRPGHRRLVLALTAPMRVLLGYAAPVRSERPRRIRTGAAR